MPDATGEGTSMTAPNHPADGLADFAELMTHEEEFISRRDRIAPEVRRARRRRGFIVAAACLVLLLAASGGYVGWALTAPVAPP